MNNLTLFNRLKELHLTDHEAKCYLSLLEKETLTVTEVSRIAEIPRANAYEALEKLLVKGLCVSIPGKTKRYKASDPAFLEEKVLVDLDEEFRVELENLDTHFRKKREEVVERKKAASENLGNLVEELMPLYNGSRSNKTPLEYIEIIKDRKDRCLISRKFMQLSEKAEREILAFSYPPYQGPKIAAEQTDQQHDLLKKGLKIRGVYEIPTDEEERRFLSQYIEAVTRQGEESRVIENLPLHMAIFDERTVILALEDPVLRKFSLTSLVIEHRNMAKTMKIVFETLWAQAEDHHVLQKRENSELI